MKKSLQIFMLFLSFNVVAHEGNLVIIVDNLQQETVKTQEINMTHQCVTALQQKSSLVLVSTSLWKNIVNRKKNFAKKLENDSSIESKLFDLYKTTNKELNTSRYNLTTINQKLSQTWFDVRYPELAALPEKKFNQIRFDFLCYNFDFDMSAWHVHSARTGMLLFVPRKNKFKLDDNYELFDKKELLKHAGKKSNVVESLQKLLKNDEHRWVIYFTGHGHPKSSQQGANIAGLKMSEFKKVLKCFNDEMHIKLLVYSSCYGGGVHTVAPYGNLQLNYPIIVTAVTDAPIFGFGLFEGVKLPPYHNDFKLKSEDVLKNHGLLPHAMQNYKAFFKRAWKGLFDLDLVQLISKFFSCDFLLCHVQKIENFPLIRKNGDMIFRPVRDNRMVKLVQQVTANGTVSSSKPLLLYTKKVKKIKISKPVTIVSMLPGIVSHEIGELVAEQIPLSQLISESFLSLEEMQAYKNFMIKKLSCFNDLIGDNKNAELFTDVLVLDQQSLMPKFLDEKAEALIYLNFKSIHYLLVWNDRKITKTMQLNQKQIAAMSEIKKFVNKSVNYDAKEAPTKLLTFDSYVKNKAYQNDLIGECVKKKICKK